MSITGKRVWFVVETFHPEDEGVGYYTSRCAFGFAEHFASEKKLTIGAICTQPSYSHKGTYRPKREIYRGVEIFRCPTIPLDRQNLLKRMVNQLSTSLSMFFGMLWRVRKGDVIFVSSVPPMLPFLAVIACHVKRAKCVIWSFDLYPEIAVVVGLLNPTGRFTRWAARTRDFFYRRADAILVLGRDMEKLLHEKLLHEKLLHEKLCHEKRTHAQTSASPSTQQSPEPLPSQSFSAKPPLIHYVPLFVDTHDIQPTPRLENPFLNELGLQKKFVVQIAGNLGFVHDVELFLAAAKELEDTPEIHFLLFSSGKKIPLIERAVSEEHRTNITIHPRLPRERTTEIVNACDLAISSLFLPGMYGLASPSRTYGILAAGKPVLALTEAETEVDLQIQENGIGWTVLPHDLPGFVAAIRDAYAYREELGTMGKAARRAAETKYTPEIVIRQIAKIIEPLL